MATFAQGDIIHGTGACKEWSKMHATARIGRGRRNCLIQKEFGRRLRWRHELDEG